MLEPFGAIANHWTDSGIDQFGLFAKHDFEVLGGRQLHRQQGVSLIFVVAKDADDVRVFKFRADEGFMFELLDFVFILAIVTQQDLQGDPLLFAGPQPFPDLSGGPGPDHS